ncbi:MAG: aminopeptidase P family protein, partial [Candidatus Omnitrophica bacterium]|nr:aminopeptidase P family protein [Candidatus Omnitrophota bacterium]
MTAARLIIADSEKNANLYYATRFLAPDPFIFVQINGRRIIVMSDLEVDRAKTQARVDEVLSYTKLTQQAKRAGVKEPTMTDVVVELLNSRTVKTVDVPADFSLTHADRLRKRGVEVQPTPDPFFP